jgi:hypothetical protein
MPAHTMFARVVQRLRDIGCLKVKKHDGGGARRNMRTPRFEEEVLRRVEDEPSTST